MPARSVCLVTVCLSEAGPGRFGGWPPFTGFCHTFPFHTIPYHTILPAVPARSVCVHVVTPSLFESGPGLLGYQQSFADVYHTVPYHTDMEGWMLKAFALASTPTSSPFLPYLQYTNIVPLSTWCQLILIWGVFARRCWVQHTSRIQNENVDRMFHVCLICQALLTTIAVVCITLRMSLSVASTRCVTVALA